MADRKQTENRKRGVESQNMDQRPGFRGKRILVVSLVVILLMLVYLIPPQWLGH